MAVTGRRLKVAGRIDLVAVLFFLVLAWGCGKENSDETGVGTLKISFRLLNDGLPLTTTDQYFNGSGESYTVRTFKFYVSNLQLTSMDNRISEEKESYHLVDLASAESKELNTSFAGGKYKRLQFMVGVDSTRNVSGAQTGALDPMLGMFWTWNTGYIFAKLEGNSSASAEPGQAFTYHIGGFRTGSNAIRNVTLDFPADKPVTIGATTMVIIDVDVSKWFDGTHRISIAENPSIMTPGGVSLQLADNYATMFTLANVINP